MLYLRSAPLPNPEVKIKPTWQPSCTPRKVLTVDLKLFYIGNQKNPLFEKRMLEEEEEELVSNKNVVLCWYCSIGKVSVKCR